MSLGTEKNAADVLAELAEPLPSAAVECRIQSVGQRLKKEGGPGKARVLAYINARTVMDRLDKVVGPAGWASELQPPAFSGGPYVCRLGLLLEGQWIWRSDGADATQVEAAKGGASDALKRAAVQWGLFRYAYRLGDTWSPVKPTYKNQRGEWNYEIDGRPQLPDWALPEDERGQARSRPQAPRAEPPADTGAPQQQAAASQPAPPGARLGPDETVHEDGLADSDLPAIPTDPGADGMWPDWAYKPMLFGEFKGTPLIELTQGTENGRRHAYLQFLAHKLAVKQDEWHEKNRQKKSAYRWLLKKAEERLHALGSGGQAPEGDAA